MKFNIFRKQNVESYLGKDIKFSKTMNAVDLMSLGVGAVIGTGIFILPGTVAATLAGPGVSLSFVVAAIVCALAGMCYAEFASAIPVLVLPIHMVISFMANLQAGLSVGH